MPVLFTDDMSIIVTDYSPIDFQTNIKEVFEHFNKWFILNLLSLFLQNWFYSFQNEKHPHFRYECWIWQ